jgi:hypothetical protein
MARNLKFEDLKFYNLGRTIMSTNHGKAALVNPEPYRGEVSRSGDMITVIEAATYFDMPPLLRRFGEWAVTERGVECLTSKYLIEKDRFGEDDWFTHMEEKTWVNMDDFKSAFFAAEALLDAGYI